MNKLALFITIISFVIWPVRFFSENKNIDFQPKHIFTYDYQAQQLVLRNINIYPSVPLARMFQNKLIIKTNKYFDNLFNFLDPNYYFFGSHPREVPGGQNYTRLPLLALVPFLMFLFLSKVKLKKNFVIFFLLTISLLSMFTNHFRYDFLLWPFFIYAVYQGLKTMKKQNVHFASLFFILLSLESIYELVKFFK